MDIVITRKLLEFFKSLEFLVLKTVTLQSKSTGLETEIKSIDHISQKRVIFPDEDLDLNVSVSLVEQ